MQTVPSVQSTALPQERPIRNFLRIATGENIAPIMGELMRKPGLWNADTSRQDVAGTLAETDAILIRYPYFHDGEEYASSTETPWRPAAADLPSVRGVILRLMNAVGAYSLGRVLISRLPPGAIITAHADAGMAYADQRDIGRYHVILQGLPGSLFTCGDETVCMATGDVWTFSAPTVHGCINNSSADRLHLVVDLLVWGRE